ncbi:hypothetical protein AA0313_0506 [Acetobacter indonesiensis NRIC 0313]|uniref:Glycosyl transferase n=1 Tax=Acetobacter indonesiensis TaxID=104101 RepID=A0A6N3T5J3_9PROT|nr:hypothetical protein [Acetobacter indonesiensis]GAN62494.1 glycosyl transferase [Acetobacter indonesiensis]GBQ54233.1 hypothetical protein AA0313_0506 [Acetobacter indonesiensis NRIC 0313]GEN03230.1 hypothetical protein AIN02nite_12550 [Acetobacter indonesiensis]
MFYFGVEGLEDGHLLGDRIVTEQKLLRAVNLTVVITDFNRKPYLLPSQQKLSNALQAASTWADRLSVVVADNSQTVTDDEACGAKVIPNLNLGGSGGFTRGLLYAKDNHYTHCLFMDDIISYQKYLWKVKTYPYHGVKKESAFTM